MSPRPPPTAARRWCGSDAACALTKSFQRILAILTQDRTSEEIPRGSDIMAQSARVALRILLAEDTLANIHLYKAVLEAGGHKLTVAEHGVEAVEKACAEPHDLILMDLGLPRITGLEAAERIRAAGVRTPIIALTADDEPSIRKACQNVGMAGYLTKPISPALLVKTVEAIAAESLAAG